MLPDHSSPGSPAEAPIAAREFLAAPVRDAAPAARRPGRAHVFAYALLALAVLLAVAVLVLLPKFVPPPAPEQAASPAPAVAPSPAGATDASADPLLTPAEKAAARLDAQNALAAVLQLADILHARKADEWAAEDWQAVQTAIAAGETAYREQRFPAALRSYAEAAKDLQAIEKRIPEVASGYVESGERALLANDGVAAQDAFARALALAPDERRAQQGLQRAQSLDRVLALIKEAQGYETLGDVERARSAYREALTLDAQASVAAQALERIDRARADREFARMMSVGYQALEGQRFDVAKASFEQASKLRPRSTEAANALKQTALRASSARIEQALKAAANHERAERWNEAAGHYRAALAIDRSLDVANRGLSRASARAAIDLEMQKTLAQAERLREEAVYGQAQALLANARAVAAPGPKLKRQIAELAAAIKHYRTPVSVLLQSDGHTAVRVTRVGAFQPFARQQLSLLAGRYTAIGQREGYRDVRVEFTVDPASPPPSVEVRCTEMVRF